jgi:hypothetical protein
MASLSRGGGAKANKRSGVTVGRIVALPGVARGFEARRTYTESDPTTNLGRRH